MNSTILALVIAVFSISASPAFANDGNDDGEYKIKGRTLYSIEVTLRERGLDVSNVEEWGGYIRAWVPNADGGADMQFFDIATLQPVQLALG